MHHLGRSVQPPILTTDMIPSLITWQRAWLSQQLARAHPSSRKPSYGADRKRIISGGHSQNVRFYPDSFDYRMKVEDHFLLLETINSYTLEICLGIAVRPLENEKYQRIGHVEVYRTDFLKIMWDTKMKLINII
jgi:hypothetical protein